MTIDPEFLNKSITAAFRDYVTPSNCRSSKNYLHN
jgi:hypothetical protein